MTPGMIHMACCCDSKPPWEGYQRRGWFCWFDGWANPVQRYLTCIRGSHTDPVNPDIITHTTFTTDFGASAMGPHLIKEMPDRLVVASFSSNATGLRIFESSSKEPPYSFDAGTTLLAHGSGSYLSAIEIGRAQDTLIVVYRRGGGNYEMGYFYKTPGSSWQQVILSTNQYNRHPRGKLVDVGGNCYIGYNDTNSCTVYKVLPNGAYSQKSFANRWLGCVYPGNCSAVVAGPDGAARVLLRNSTATYWYLVHYEDLSQEQINFDYGNYNPGFARITNNPDGSGAFRVMRYVGSEVSVSSGVLVWQNGAWAPQWTQTFLNVGRDDVPSSAIRVMTRSLYKVREDGVLVFWHQTQRESDSTYRTAAFTNVPGEGWVEDAPYGVDFWGYPYDFDVL